MGILEPIISLIVFAVIIAIIVAKTKNIWGKYPYTNGGKATKEYYVRQKKKKGGVSINSAGSYRLIEYYAFISAGDVSFRIWNDNKVLFKNNFSGPIHFDLICELPTGEKTDAFMVMEKGSSDISFVVVEDNNKFIELLKNNKNLKIVIASMEGSELDIKYQFRMARGNFLKVYNSINNKF